MVAPKQQRSAAAAKALLLAAMCAMASTAAAAVHGRTLLGPHRKPPRSLASISYQGAPGNITKVMSSCAWTGDTCTSSMAPVFDASRNATIHPANYPAWAKAYIAANDLFCSQFAKGKCAWPCEYDEGVGCRVDGHLFYQPWNCADSIAEEDNKCSQEPQLLSEPACLRNPACSWSDSVSDPQERCMSSYAANLTSQQRLYVFGNLYYNVMPRQLLGCCRGSTYMYKLNNFCDAAFDNQTGIATKESCAKVPGCQWNIYSADGCVPTPTTVAALQFAYKPQDPFRGELAKLGDECQAITDAAKCDSYKPVKVDPTKVQLYMNDGLRASFNAPVKAKDCPLPSVPPPWV